MSIFFLFEQETKSQVFHQNVTPYVTLLINIVDLPFASEIVPLYKVCKVVKFFDRNKITMEL